MQPSPYTLRTGIYSTIEPESFKGKLVGQVALVTGSSRGIGRAIARALAQAGASVAVTGKNKTNVDAAVAEISLHGTKTIGIVADVLLRHDLERMVEEVNSRLGPIDILVNNAGTNMFMPFHLTQADSWWNIMELNVRSPVELTRLVLPSMQKRNKGVILFTSSRAAAADLPWTTAYNCSKTSVTRFAGTLQAEMDQVQTNVNGFPENGIELFSFHPGEVDTDLHMTSYPSSLETDAPYVLDHMSKISAKRPHFEPELPAWTVVFLASGRAKALRGSYIDSTRDVGEQLADAAKSRKNM